MANIDNNFRTGYIVRINYTVNSQNVANNTSNVTVKAQFISTGSSYNINATATKYGTLTINGTAYNFTFNATLAGGQTKTVKEVTVDIPHNADGTKSCSMSLYLGIDVTLTGVKWDSVTASGTANFPTIPRKNEITSVSGTTIGSTMTVGINKKNSSSTTTIYIAFPGYDWDVMVSKTSNSTIQFTIPASYVARMSNTSSVSVRIIARTFNGDTQVGDVETTRTLTIPRNSITLTTGSTIGSEMTVNISRIHSNLTTTLYLCVEGHDWHCAVTKSTSTSIKVTIPAHFIEWIPNATSKSIKLVARTFNGTAQVGDHEWSKTINIPKCSINTVSGSTIGSNMTVTVNKPHSSLTVSLDIKTSSGSWVNVANKSTSSSITFEVPKSLANNLPNATSNNATIRMTTYNGTASIGTQDWNRTIYVPDWMVPTISGVILNTTTVVNGSSLYIKDKSQLAVKTSASGTYSSTITNTEVQFDDVSYWGTDITTNILRVAGTRNVKVIVTDTRGRTATWTGSINVVNYSNPTGSIKVYRCNANGIRDDVGGVYVRVEFSATYSSMGGANDFSYTIDHRQVGHEWSPTDHSGTEPADGHVVILGTAISQYDLDKAYDVRLAISDSYTTVVYTIPLSTASVFLDFKAGGRGLGIGRLCTEDDTVQTDKIIQIFAGRGGDPNLGADLNFCNVSNENQRIGWCGGTPASNHLILLHRFTDSASGNAGTLMKIDKWNACYYNFVENYFANGLKFYDGGTTSTHHEGTIRFDGSSSYFYFHNPTNNSHGLGAYNSNVGTIFHYNATSQQLLLKAGFGTTSDRRLKYDFNEFENWDKYHSFYMSLKPQTFKYNNDMRKETFIGMMAQDVADSIVESGLNNEKLTIVKCSENDAMEDGREYSLAYQEFISLNIKMIQKQELEIQELKEIISQQQELIDSLITEN